MTVADPERPELFTPRERGMLLAASLRPGWPGAGAADALADPDRRQTLADLWTANGVAPLIWHRLKGTGLTAVLDETVHEMAVTSEIADLVQSDGLGDVLEVLRARGVEPVLLKGLAVARFYPRPSLRPGGDLDFWVRPREVGAARAALRDAGFGTTYDPGIPFPSENTFSHTSGLLIDLKGWFKGIPPSLHRCWWRRAIEVAIDGTPVRVLAPPDDLVYLSNHALRHVYGSAKWLMDIVMLLDQWDRERWGPVALPAAQPARNWTLVTLGLALMLLDADGSALSPGLHNRAWRAAAPWRDGVLEAWGGAEVESAAITLPLALARLRAERSPAAAGRLLRDLWPRPMEAAVYLQLPLRPRLSRPVQAAAFARRRLWAPFWHLRAHALTLRGRVRA